MPVHAITGCMFSGKTEALCLHLRVFLIAEKKVKIFVPVEAKRAARGIDDILPNSKIPNTPKAIYFKNPPEISDLTEKSDQIIAVDEAQFINKRKEIEEFLAVLEKIKKGRDVYVAGLDTDFLHRPWGAMPDVMAVADNIFPKLKAVCMKCKNLRASCTQRLVKGKPAPKDSPQEAVGDIKPNKDEISYEARCEDCFEIGK